jgi:hypothetical protein
MEIVPEEIQLHASIVRAMVAPALRERRQSGAKLKGPYLSVESSVPEAQIPTDRGIRYSSFLVQLTKRGIRRTLARLDGSFDQLNTR